MPDRKTILDYEGKVKVTESGFIFLGVQDLATVLRDTLPVTYESNYGQQNAGRLHILVELVEEGE